MIRVYFYPTFAGIDAYYGDACTDFEGNILLDIQTMQNRCKEKNMTFEHYFSECISHEIIHCLLRQHVSWDAGKRFDNICIRKQRKKEGSYNPKTWKGGIPWWEHEKEMK